MRQITGSACLLLCLAGTSSTLATDIPFGPQRIVSTSDGKGIDVIAGDLDGDGDLDLVASAGTNSPSGVYWHENLDGKGTYSTSKVIDNDAGGLSNRVSTQLVDMDGDGDLDLLTGWFYLGAWYPNDGLGHFGARTVVRDETAGGSWYTDFKAADLDGDGDLDVAAIAGSPIYAANKLVWFKNNGAGSFNPATENLVGSLVNDDSGRVVPADLDGDGDIDLVATETGATDRVVWYRNLDGAGTFSAKLTISIGSFFSLGDIAVGDIDGDGDLDVVSTDYSFSADRWHENTAGDGSAWADHAMGVSDTFSFFVNLADMDLDGDVDVLVGSRVSDQAAWLENNGNGTGWTRRLAATSVDTPAAAIAADVDGDGDPDIVTSSIDDNKFAWNENRTIHRNAAFPEAQTIAAPSNQPFAVEAADVNGDGKVDAVATSPQDDSIFWYQNDGSTPPVWTPRTISTTADGVEHVAPADVDGDGDVDVLAASFNDDTVAWYDSNGAQPPVWTKRVISAIADGAWWVGTGDLDGDGDLDALSASFNDTTLAWYDSNGANPPVWTRRTITTGLTTRRCAVADVDGDGRLDVVAPNVNTGVILYFRNNGGSPPTFTQRTVYGATGIGTPNAVTTADVDSDGDIDIVASASSDPLIAWYESNGAAVPVFTIHLMLRSVAGWFPVEAGDLDNDGDVDLLSATATNDQIVWSENNGASPPAFIEHTIALAGDPNGLAAADVDGDGDLDLLTAERLANAIQYFENKGGQYGFTGTDISTGLAYDGEAAPILAIGVQLNGRPGDSVGRLVRLSILFESGTPLNSAQANALFDELRIYRDDGSGAFDESNDILVATVGTLSLPVGVQTVILPASDPNVRVAAPATFFVVPVMTPNASQQAINSFTALHLAGEGSLMADANAGITLAGASTVDPETANVQARPRFVVNSFSDATDTTPGNGVCATAGAVCTLRAAIQESNSLAGAEHIVLGAGTYNLTIGVFNENASAGGDLDVTGPLTITGAGPSSTIIAASGADRVLDVRAGGNLFLEDLRVTGGNALGQSGSAIQVNSSGALTARRVDIRGNTSSSYAGIFNNGGTTLVEDSLIYGNTGSSVSALENDSGTSTLRNVTISGNSGGGTMVRGSVFGNTLTLDGCTIYGNTGSGLQQVGGTFQVRNTIVAGNTATSLGSFTSLGYNIIDDKGAALGFTNGTNHDQVGGGSNPVIDAKLKVLGDYGGPTLTHELMSTSPAIDAGSCGTLTKDQRGVSRPIDVAGVTNVGDACDIGAYELESGATLSRVEVPIRWCGLHGSPSIENPSLMGAANVNDLLRRRHEAASDNIYAPQSGIVFRSAASFSVQSYPVLEDPDCVQTTPGNYACERGVRGDVYIDPAVANFDEYEGLIASCRAAWQALDPKIEGVTAVQINRFVDTNGSPLSILGIGGRAKEGDVREQAEAGRVAVVDHFYRQDVPGNPDPPNPSDTIDRLLGHELGHAVSLRHGDGLDNDLNGVIDDDDEKLVGLPRFDGNNIMQYRSGSTLTAGQATQARSHLAATVPDVVVQPRSDAAPDATPIDPKNAVILDFGFNGVLNLANARILDFKNAVILDFENGDIPEFANARILDFKNAVILDFKNAVILDFGMSYSGETAGDSSSLHATTAAIPWPASLRPKTRYYFYLDVDRDDGTGAYPASKVNPSDAPNHFPGSNNVVNAQTVAEEAGVDLIAQVEIQSTCTGNNCSSTSQLKVFDYNDGTGVYTEVSSTASPAISSVEAGLYVDNGGAPVDLDTAPTGITVQPSIPNSLLFAAGWGFTTPPGGGAPVPKPVRMEVVTTIGCAGNVLNDGSAADARNCQCTSCATCPDYPGCTGTAGVPKTLAGPTILVDHRDTELTFQPPLLPACTVIPAMAAEGQAVTVYVTLLPTNLSGTVEVTEGGTVIGTTPTSSISPAGSVSVATTLPGGATGAVNLSAGITGYAPRAQCLVTVTPTLACPNADGDATCDSSDTDDDNDGVADGADSAPLNRLVCRDLDADQCDDCSSGTNSVSNDGPDYDFDGLCDRGDPDDDNDGVLDGADGAPRNANACGDSDNDHCDDCVIAATPSPGNDGPDADGDGQCDFGDIDADNDGASDFDDCAPADPTLKAAPVEVAGVGFATAGNKNRVSWTAPQAQGGSATVSDLLRGTRAGLPVGSGVESCLATGTSAAQFDDATSPAAGETRWYLVRARNACGNGGYGTTHTGAARTSSTCP